MAQKRLAPPQFRRALPAGTWSKRQKIVLGAAIAVLALALAAAILFAQSSYASKHMKQQTQSGRSSLKAELQATSNLVRTVDISASEQDALKAVNALDALAAKAGAIAATCVDSPKPYAAFMVRQYGAIKTDCNDMAASARLIAENVRNFAQVAGFQKQLAEAMRPVLAQQASDAAADPAKGAEAWQQAKDRLKNIANRDGLTDTKTQLVATAEKIESTLRAMQELQANNKPAEYNQARDVLVQHYAAINAQSEPIRMVLNERQLALSKAVKTLQ